jgi:hypothetical protein
MANIDFPKGGKTKMFSNNSAGPQVAGQSSSMGKSSDKFAKGGSKVGTLNTSAGPQKAGQTSSAGRSGDKFASGGKTHMFGKGSANAARPK